MNIDKFGHHVHKRLRVSSYFDTLNDALVRTEKGFDLKLTSLHGLPSPKSDDEAANKLYVDRTLGELYSQKDFEENVKKHINSCLKLFKQQLYESLTASYYSKPEIDNIVNTLQRKRNE